MSSILFVFVCKVTEYEPNWIMNLPFTEWTPYDCVRLWRMKGKTINVGTPFGLVIRYELNPVKKNPIKYRGIWSNRVGRDCIEIRWCENYWRYRQKSAITFIKVTKKSNTKIVTSLEERLPWIQTCGKISRKLLH